MQGKERHLICSGGGSISVAEDLIYLCPVLCVPTEPWLTWGHGSSSVQSILRNVPIYIFYRTRPKGVSFPLLGNWNYLLSELPSRLKVSLWCLPKQHGHNNCIKTTRELCFQKPKDHLWKHFKMTILFMPGCQIRATGSFLKACVSAYSRLGLALGVLQKALQLSLKLTNVASIQKNQNWDQVESPWSTKATWKEIWGRGECWKGLLYKHRQLHRNVSWGRDYVYSLHYVNYTIIVTIVVLGIVPNEWMNISDLGRSMKLACFIYVKTWIIVCRNF